MENFDLVIMAIGICFDVMGVIIYKLSTDRDISYGKVYGVVLVVIGFIILFIGFISWCYLDWQSIFTS